MRGSQVISWSWLQAAADPPALWHSLCFQRGFGYRQFKFSLHPKPKRVWESWKHQRERKETASNTSHKLTTFFFLFVFSIVEVLFSSKYFSICSTDPSKTLTGKVVLLNLWDCCYLKESVIQKNTKACFSLFLPSSANFSFLT